MSEHQQRGNNPNYRGNVVICLACGKEFQASLSKKRLHNRKYCSKACYTKVQPRKLEQEGLEETLRELYVEKKLSSYEIGKMLGCNPKTVTYWMHKFGIPPRTRSENFKVRNPAKRPDVREKMRLAAGKRWAKPEEREKDSRAHLGKRLSKEHRRKISESLLGNKRRKGIPHSEEDKKKIGEASKRLWKNPEYARKVLTALQEEPNNFERKLIGLMERYGLPFEYVGDGSVVIDGRVPDFLSTDGSKKVIEFFGRPWHDPDHSEKIEVNYSRTEPSTRDFYRTHGYGCLIIWDEELRDEAEVVEKIKEFTEAILVKVEGVEQGGEEAYHREG